MILAKDKRDLVGEREIIFSAQETVAVLQEMMQKGASCRFRAKGWSMSPLIKDGDVVTISPFSGGRIKVGQVVAVVEPRSRRLFVHRVVRRRRGKYEIKGDNLSFSDGLFDPSEIIGVVIRVERGSRTVSTTWKIWHYFMALISRSSLGMKFINYLRQLKRMSLRIKAKEWKIKR